MHHHAHDPSRRSFLQACSVLGLAALGTQRGQAADGLDASLARSGVTPLADSPQWDRSLVLIELDGGNDGLNTIIPVDDPLYYEHRDERGVAISKGDALPITGEELYRFHPSLGSQPSIWDAGDLAVVLGVGYERNNRSHFRGIDIWNTGSDADTFLDTGWLGRTLAGTPVPSDVVAEGTILRRAGSSPLEHGAIRNLAIKDPEDFIKNGRDLVAIEPEQQEAAAGRPGLQHLLQVHEDVRLASGRFAEALAPVDDYAPPSYSTPFPNSGLGQQLQGVADMLISGLRIPVHKVSFNGFDTHASQVDSNNNRRGRHADLMRELDEAIAAFRAACIEHNAWDRVTVMTYSEFGRRVKANASAGTDHGGASCHFFWGGGVQGGLYGSMPSLAEEQLIRGDLAATTDFRRLYSSALGWLGLDSSLTFGAESFTPLPVLGS